VENQFVMTLWMNLLLADTERVEAAVSTEDGTSITIRWPLVRW
jgi:hypothetical protein